MLFDDFTTPAAIGSFKSATGSSVANSTYPDLSPYPYDWQDTSKHGYYYPEKTLSVVDSAHAPGSNGALDTYLHYDATLKQNLVSATVVNTPPMTGGVFEIRLRADKIAGYKVVPLLWPDSESWPNDGEIDFPERPLDGTSPSAVLHHASASGDEDAFATKTKLTAWHTYKTVWIPPTANTTGSVEFFVDAHSVGKSTTDVPANPMHWVLQFETDVTATAPPTSAAGHVQVDWIRASKLP